MNEKVIFLVAKQRNRALKLLYSNGIPTVVTWHNSTRVWFYIVLDLFHVYTVYKADLLRIHIFLWHTFDERTGFK